jgi:hypothetical protein
VKHHSPTTQRNESVTCVSCFARISGSEAFCHACGAPVGTTATLDPIKTIQAEGFLFRRALEGRPKPIVLVCVWILHLPVFVLGVWAAFYSLIYMEVYSGFAYFLFMMGLSCLALAILYRVTKNYLTIPKKR